MRPGDNGDDAWEASELGCPIDIESLRADDELIESLRAAVIRAPGDRSGEASAGRDPEAELRAMLSAWVVDVRPETVATTAIPHAPAELPAAFRVADEAVPVPVGPITAARTCPAHPPQYARRFAVAASLVVLLGSGLAVGAWDAQPGGTLWPVAKVFYVERAKSVQAATDVDAGLQRARTALDEGRKVDAAAAIATVVATLDQVGPGQGHDRLARLNQDLVVALDDPGLLAQAIAATPGATAALAAAPLANQAAERTVPPTAAPEPAPATSGGTPAAGRPADPAPSAAQPPAPLPWVPHPAVPPPASLPSGTPPPATDRGPTGQGPAVDPFVELTRHPTFDPRPPAAEQQAPAGGAPGPQPGAAVSDPAAPGAVSDPAAPAATALIIWRPADATGRTVAGPADTVLPSTAPTGSSSSPGASASSTPTDTPTRSGSATPADTSRSISSGSGSAGPGSGGSGSGSGSGSSG